MLFSLLTAKHSFTCLLPVICFSSSELSFYGCFIKTCLLSYNEVIVVIIIFIIFFLHGLGRLTCSGIDALPSFPGASTISSSSKFVVEGVFRKSGVVHSFEMVDPVLFVFEYHVLYSRDLYSFSYDFASYFV